MDNKKRRWIQWIPFALFLMGIGLIIYFRLYQYFDLKVLKQYQQTLHAYTETHYWQAVFYYLLVATAAMAFAVPGVILAIIAGGFLFGLFDGIIYVTVAMLAGSSITFFATKTAFRAVFKERAKPWLQRFQQGFHNDAGSYLLSLRLLPGLPIWLVNIIAGLFDVRFSIFFYTALVGMLPLNFIRVWTGTVLNYILMRPGEPDLKMFMNPKIGLLFVTLALLILLRVFCKNWLQRRKGIIKTQ